MGAAAANGRCGAAPFPLIFFFFCNNIVKNSQRYWCNINISYFSLYDSLPLHQNKNISSRALPAPPPPPHRRLWGWDDAKGGASCHGGSAVFTIVHNKIFGSNSEPCISRVFFFPCRWGCCVLAMRTESRIVWVPLGCCDWAPHPGVFFFLFFF